MHFEFLVEDQSSRHAMDILLPKLLPDNTTYNIHHYRGIGRIPKNLRPKTDAHRQHLMLRPDEYLCDAISRIELY